MRVLMWPPNATTKCTSCTERPLPRPSGYEPVLSRCRFATSACTWTVSSIPRLTKTLHQSYNDGMVNTEVICRSSMAKTTAMHANSLPPLWYGSLSPHHTKRIENETLNSTHKNQLSFANTNVEKYTWHFTHPVIYT